MEGPNLDALAFSDAFDELRSNVYARSQNGRFRWSGHVFFPIQDFEFFEVASFEVRRRLKFSESSEESIGQVTLTRFGNRYTSMNPLLLQD